jgi:hypothetical protein
MMSALVACGAGFMGCGGAADDIVYLQVLHAYPGAPAMSLYGPEGAIVSNLKFGQTTDEPIEFNRANFNGSLTLVMDGLPGQSSVSLDLFALYPQETATIVAERRTGTTEVQTQLLRHLIFTGKEAYEQCIIAPYNLLSTTNDNFLIDAYSFMMQIQGTPTLIQSSYNQANEQQIDTECGKVSLSDLEMVGTLVKNKRKEQIDKINADKFLFPVQDPEDATLQVYVWGVWANGTAVNAVPRTKEFVECISGAIQIKQPESSSMTQEQATCPVDLQGRPVIPFTDTNMNGTRDPGEPLSLEVNFQGVQDCLEKPTVYQGFAYLPGQGATANTYLGYTSDVPTQCTSTWRFRSQRIANTIYDQGETQGASGTRADDQLVTIGLDHPSHTTQTVVLYGRPLDPLVFQYTDMSRSTLTTDYPGGKDKDGLGVPRTEEPLGEDRP